jgi:hypothetical protein
VKSSGVFAPNESGSGESGRFGTRRGAESEGFLIFFEVRADPNFLNPVV